MLDETFELFSKYLQTRLLKNVYCTEDSVRYTFFAALLRSTNLNPEDLILEYHPNIPNAEIDTFIPSYDGTGVVMEFKYDRKIPSQKNAPRPQKAGKLFNDMSRLLRFDETGVCIRIFIYLTDDEMANYMQNQNNNLSEFFKLQKEQKFIIDATFFNNKSITFQNSVGSIFDANLLTLFSRKITDDHYLKILRIDPLDAGRIC